MFSCIKSGILGGIIVFLWGMISWMAFTWHTTSVHGFKDEKIMSDIIVANAPQSGVFVLPYGQMQGKTEQTPPPVFIFATVDYTGAQKSMTSHVIVGLVTQIAAALLVAWMLAQTSGLSYIGRVGFVVVFALAAGIVTHLPYWNWFGFDTNYTLIYMADLLIAWFLAGLVMAKCYKRR